MLFCLNEKKLDTTANFLKEGIKDKRSQDLPKHYRLNGAIYIAKVEKALEEKTFFLKDNIYGFIMDKYSSIDIDDAFDFKIAECLTTFGIFNKHG